MQLAWSSLWIYITYLYLFIYSFSYVLFLVIVYFCYFYYFLLLSLLRLFLLLLFLLFLLLSPFIICYFPFIIISSILFYLLIYLKKEKKKKRKKKNDSRRRLTREAREDEMRRKTPWQLVAARETTDSLRNWGIEKKTWKIVKKIYKKGLRGHWKKWEEKVVRDIERETKRRHKKIILKGKEWTRKTSQSGGRTKEHLLVCFLCSFFIYYYYSSLPLFYLLLGHYLSIWLWVIEDACWALQIFGVFAWLLLLIHSLLY